MLREHHRKRTAGLTSVPIKSLAHINALLIGLDVVEEVGRARALVAAAVESTPLERGALLTPQRSGGSSRRSSWTIDTTSYLPL
jgi:hypothetical protein